MVPAISMALAAVPAVAQDATWLANPASTDFNSGTNWNTGVTPGGLGTAFFGPSSRNGVVYSGSGTLGGLVLLADAPAYVIALDGRLALDGAGIAINGGRLDIFVNQVGPGHLVFDNASSAGTATIHNDNFIDFTGTSSGGAATIISTNTLNFQGAASAGFATITNRGRLVFLADSSAGSAMIQNDGTLDFADASSAGSATITNTATMSFLATSSAGSANIVNSGSASFLGTASARSATIANNGALSFSDASTAGNARIHNTNKLDFRDTSSAGQATIVNDSLMRSHDTSTAGNANITNNTTWQFQDTSTAGSATITNNGVSAFRDSSSAGSATFANNGDIFFTGRSNAENARLINTNTGRVDFSATSGPNGDHRVSAGSIEGGGKFFLGSNLLVVGSNNLSTEVSGVVADGGTSGGIAGSLQKVGTGTLTLSGQNTYTGTTQVNAGALIVNGALASGVFVANGGLLGGSGVIGATTVDNGGTLAPGNAGDPLSVRGNLVLESAATYLVQVGAAGAGRANVSGTATVAGTAQAVFGPSSFMAQHATILTANGGVSGTFAALTTNLAANAATLSYDANNVFLNLASPFSNSTGLNQNQRNVANALNGAFVANGGLPFAFYNLSPNGLTQVSGELGTGIIQSSIGASNQFLNVMLDPFITGRSAAMGEAASAPSFAFASDGSIRAATSANTRDAYAAVKARAPGAADLLSNRWSVWGAVYGGSGITDGNAALGSHATASRTFGLVAGADYRFSPDLLLGFALAGGGTSFSVADGLGRGSSDLFQSGVFARQKFGAAYLSGALAYGWQNVTTDRTLAVAGIDQLQARFKADTFSGRFEGGYHIATPLAGITPYAALQVTSFALPNYSEHTLTGGGLFGLDYRSQTVTATRNELGARFDRSWALETALLTLRGRAAWAHDYNTERSVMAVFQTLPVASFVVNGARAAPDAALLSAGAELAWASGISIAGTFEGEFSNSTQSYAGKGTLRYSW